MMILARVPKYPWVNVGQKVTAPKPTSLHFSTLSNNKRNVLDEVCTKAAALHLATSDPLSRLQVRPITSPSDSGYLQLKLQVPVFSDSSEGNSSEESHSRSAAHSSQHSFANGEKPPFQSLIAWLKPELLGVFLQEPTPLRPLHSESRQARVTVSCVPRRLPSSAEDVVDVDDDEPEFEVALAKRPYAETDGDVLPMSDPIKVKLSQGNFNLLKETVRQVLPLLAGWGALYDPSMRKIYYTKSTITPVETLCEELSPEQPRKTSEETTISVAQQSG